MVIKFQSALPRGERRFTSFKCSASSIFQSALPRGERLWFDLDAVKPISISRRAPTRGATPSTRPFRFRKGFQSALPRGERLSITVQSVSAHLFQSALPRGERQKSDQDHCDIRAISIRAPTRGATSIFITPFLLNIISIRAPTRGATRKTPKHQTDFEYFNPRSHEGSDND